MCASFIVSELIVSMVKVDGMWIVSNISMSRGWQSHSKIAADTQLCNPPNTQPTLSS